MSTNERQLQEQEAPEKNTDDAFVRVGSDGHPLMPQAEDDAKAKRDEQQPAPKPLK